MDLSIRQGETLEFTVIGDDLTALTVRFLAKKKVGTGTIDETESFSTEDGKRIAEFKITDTQVPEGEYEYMLTVTYPDDVIEKLPDAADCDGDCTFPILTICDALDMEVS